MPKWRSLFMVFFLNPEEVFSTMSLIIASDTFLSNFHNPQAGCLFFVIFIYNFSLVLFSCLPMTFYLWGMTKCFWGVQVSGYRQKNSNNVRMEKKSTLVTSKWYMYVLGTQCLLYLIMHGTDSEERIKCVLVLNFK